MWKYAIYIFVLILLSSIIIYEQLTIKKNKKIPNQTKVSDWDDSTVHTESEI